MVIQFEGKYKSLSSFKSEELTDFVLITGKNGSGKTQLVQLPQTLQYDRHPNSPNITVQPHINNIQIEGLSIKGVQTAKGDSLSKQVESDYNNYRQISYPLRKFILELILNGLDFKKIDKPIDIFPFMSGDDHDQKFQRVLEINSKYLGGVEWGNNERDRHEKNLAKLVQRLKQWKRAITAAEYVAQYKGKTIEDELTLNEFYSTPISETLYTFETPFTVQIENLFYGYARKRFINEMEYNRKINYGNENNSVPDHEFVSEFPPPWKQINEILERHNIKLRVVEIQPENFSPEYQFDFYLTDISNEENIPFSELSSGEQIIVGLIIRLFLTQRYQTELKFPDFFILDEPDAFLHPEMSLLLLEVLHKTFTNELGIRVLITTHSPSTVALAPEDCIYELTNGKSTTLKKIAKDYALKILTDKLPLLSIDYSHHRQIFVESPIDQFYYQTIFNKLKTAIRIRYNLYFITSGYGKSNCDQVVTLTKELRAAGNKSSFGIVDWDLTRNPEENIYVHGFNKFYSIENFIYNPIYLCILFIEQNCSNKISDLGFDLTYNQYNVINESSDRLQELTDWIINKVSKKFPTLISEDKIGIKYSNDKTTFLPRWYLETKGHNLEQKLRQVFESLQSFPTQVDLTKKLTSIIGKCYPFVPNESKELILKLANE